MRTLTTILLLTAFTGFAQEQIAITVAQDAKLLFVGDNKGNPAGTLNIVITTQWQGNETKAGYLFIAPSFEYADLATPFRRYSANVGWSVPIVPKFEGSLSFGYGVIDHGGASQSFGGDVALIYEVFKGVDLFVNAQVLQRGDIGKVRFSGFFGVKVGVFDTNWKGR